MPARSRADVLVVGGGPAGALTALLVARAGFEVDLIDRAHFPRPKPCGEFVNPGALRLLERVGLLDAVSASTENVITGWDLHTDGPTVAKGGYGPFAWGMGVSRSDFDLRLLDAARAAGARVREGVTARSISSQGPLVVTVRTSGGAREKECPTVLVGADGLNSIVSRSLGGRARRPKRPKLSLSAHLDGVGPDRQRGHMFVSESLTVGLAATGRNDRWNATVVVGPPGNGCFDPRRVLMERLTSVPVSWTNGPELVDGPWASGPFDRAVERVAGPNFVLVGDASGYYDPLTGQGIYRALRSAELAAPRIVAALTHPTQREAQLSAYAREVSKDRRGGRAVQHGVEHVMRHRRVRRWTFQHLANRSNMLNALLRVTGDVDRIRSLAHPSVWLPLWVGSPLAEEGPD